MLIGCRQPLDCVDSRIHLSPAIAALEIGLHVTIIYVSIAIIITPIHRFRGIYVFKILEAFWQRS
jgi:hypothetical protein